MLTRFSVSNFKGFKDEFVLDLTNPSSYEFNGSAIKNGVVNNAIIYGKNGVGKSNLGLAIFDILGHYSEVSKAQSRYVSYFNGNTGDTIPVFNYEFKFGQNKLKYKYKKIAYKAVKEEELSINGEIVAYLNREIEPQALIALSGTESLEKIIKNKRLSLIRYIKTNANLNETKRNKVILEFFSYLDKMLFFRSLNINEFMSVDFRNEDIEEAIINMGQVEQLECFLNEAGVDCKLEIVGNFKDQSFVQKPSIFMNFNNIGFPFFQIASTGTLSLTLFFYWFQKMKNGDISFLFIDEFDAFYHFDLAKLIVKKLKETGVQFILTTHNTAIISNDLLRPDCYFLMNKEKIQSFTKSTEKELREAHNLQKMYKANAFSIN